jgi:hypothetical protein
LAGILAAALGLAPVPVALLAVATLLLAHGALDRGAQGHPVAREPRRVEVLFQTSGAAPARAGTCRRTAPQPVARSPALDAQPVPLASQRSAIKRMTKKAVDQ